MTQIPFDADTNLLIFECQVEFRFVQQVRLALDTGASLVTLSRQVIEVIGYDLNIINNLESFGNASQIHT